MSQTYPKPRALAMLIGIMALALLAMGTPLMLLGGSWYYLTAGFSLFVCALMLYLGDRRAIFIYAALLAGTVAWAVFEVGLDPWSLLPRLGLFFAIGLLFCIPRVRRGLYQSEVTSLWRQRPMQIGCLLIAGFAVVLLVTNLSHDVHSLKRPLIEPTQELLADWQHYGASKAGTRYAAHASINRGSVAQLERAWETRTGVPGTFKGTPIQIRDNLLLCTGQNVILALDPDSGEERWRFDPEINTPRLGFWDTCRGITYHQEPTLPKDALCAERIFTATTDARLLAVDMPTGQRCPDFGNNGEISLLPGMGDVKPGFYFVTSPPTIANGVLVLGGWVADNQETEEPSGVVRGFDPLNGELRWAWDLGRDDRSGLPPPGETYTRGTPNVWSLTSADEDLGLIYVPTGNATPDYYGGHRSEAMEAYASSIVALDAATGKPRWHFQTTHHDIWDYDVPSQPTLVDVPINGHVRQAVIVPTKRAEIFLLDRATGEPITEVIEQPTPQTTTQYEWTSPTQPFSSGMPSFAHKRLSETDMWGITPFDQLICRLKFRQLDYQGPLTPPSVNGTLYYPGVAGGMNWGSVAVDEVNHLMVVNVLHLPFQVTLIPRDDFEEEQRLGVGGAQRGTPYAVESIPFLSPLFVPCLRPPYGEMAVVDLTNQNVLWRRGVGTARELGPLGLASGLPLPMGVFYEAGSMVTQGGLIFNGGIADSTFRAIDILTGEELWQDRLPGSSQATPMSYISPNSGRQYVVVVVPHGQRTPLSAEHGAGETRNDSPGGYVIAYALPDSA